MMSSFDRLDDEKTVAESIKAGVLTIAGPAGGRAVKRSPRARAVSGHEVTRVAAGLSRT